MKTQILIAGMILLFLSVAFAPEAAGAAGQAKDHPPLLDVKTAKCSTCHADVLQGEIHPALEAGCDNCHIVEKADGKTRVSLVATGAELCVSCHEDKSGLSAKKAPHAPSEDCLNCHTPHSSRNKPLLKSSLPELCFECHDREEMIRTAHKGQPVQAGTCVSCHNPHGSDEPKLLKAKKQHPPFAERACDACHRKTRIRELKMISPLPELCYACHSELESKFKGTSVHKPVREGRCPDCHDPHQSDFPKFLKDRPEKLCAACHKDVQALVNAGAHAPAKESCETCHSPHSSGNPMLLNDGMVDGGRIASICGACHDLAGLKAKHRQAELSKVDCLGCHNPHGSKTAHLINSASTHPPFAEGCDNCHANGTALVQEPPDLCYTCHDDVQQQVQKATQAHPAIEMGCTSCHTPHAGSQPKLFSASQITVCGSCHEETVKQIESAPFVHGAITRDGCQACHTPHGGSISHLLKKGAPDLCLNCHGEGSKDSAPKILFDRVTQKNHPIPEHPVAPNGGSCLSCHDPHSGRNAFLFAKQAASETDLCASCHKK